MIYKNWTVEIVKVVDGKNGRTAYVDFTNAGKTESRVFKDLTSKDQLISQAMRMIDSLEADITVDTVLEVPVQVVPTQDETDQALWLQTYYRLEQLEKLAEKAFLTGAKLTALNKKISDSKAFLDANAKVAYLDII